VCRSAGSTDGEWLARLFAARDAASRTRAAVRRQTLKMIARVIQLAEIRQMTRQASEFVAYHPQAVEDDVLAGIDIVGEWRGLILRNHSVAAWRALWAWLVNSIGGLTSLMPSQTGSRMRCLTRR
jgi:hypothetical protein